MLGLTVRRSLECLIMSPSTVTVADQLVSWVFAEHVYRRYARKISGGASLFCNLGSYTHECERNGGAVTFLGDLVAEWHHLDMSYIHLFSSYSIVTHAFKCYVM